MNEQGGGPDEGRSKMWRKPKSWWTLGIPLGGVVAFVLGAVALGSYNWVIHETSKNEFCYVCHSHEAFIKPEYEASSHFTNVSGVRASCGDCHLPHGWWELTYTKIHVSIDIIPELMGKISTKEKYEQHRGELAQAAWATFKANDSEYCRHCHTTAAMDLENQSRMASRRHAQAEERGQTCVDCHQGIVHALPENWRELYEEVEAELSPH